MPILEPIEISDLAQSIASGSPDPKQTFQYLTSLKEQHPDTYARLTRTPGGLSSLAAVFGSSRFLSAEILKHPGWLENLEPLDRSISAEEYVRLLETGNLTLTEFRRQQMLRIFVRDARGLATLAEVTGELSNLADAMLDVSYRRARAELVVRHGAPRCDDAECGMAVVALGKLGGEELNYSSDIDLMFVYTAPGLTEGPHPISNKEFYKKVANRMTDLLSCYRVDLRLRPDGRHGEICISLEGAKNYYEGRARDWERQMLIKARVVAGDIALGRELLDVVEPLIYSSTIDFSAVESVSAARERISERLVARRGARASLDVKLAPGGIRDIEFLVQCLQRLHGGRVPWVRHGGTLLALSRLYDKDLLSSIEYGKLVNAYRFLRTLEHRLQIVDDIQTHMLPDNPRELDLLARRVSARDGGELLEQLEACLRSVREIYDQVIHAQKQPASPPKRKLDLPVEWRPTEGFTRELFELSPYFADELLRTPALVSELEKLDEPDEDYQVAAAGLKDATALRQFYRQQMFRIQAASVCLGQPIFQTLARNSDLADAVIGAAYRIALQELGGDRERMIVVALGRLGMREFDLASDADLVFVLPNENAPESLFWTRVANRIMDILSSYTGTGMIFAVDTRLRPNGSAGALVQCESAYMEYFARHAEAWEGIAYMKARAVAGDMVRSTLFLNALQELDWRRYGQSGRSKKDLRQMRIRLEKEQGSRNPLKAGAGGFYDIDFALLYLRLKSGGIFYPVLNMPERIDIIEKMGHLEREDAAFLRDAVTFYRAVDHGLRVCSGHAEGTLPNSDKQIKALTRMVRQWTGTAGEGLGLREQLEEIRKGTREIFDRLFS